MKTKTTDRWRYRKSKTPYHAEEDVGYEALAMAIIKQAVMDWRFANDCEKGARKVCEEYYCNRLAGLTGRTKNEIERFFRSQWYGILCDIPGEYILKRLEAQE
jgi:hypothetical protein